MYTINNSHIHSEKIIHALLRSYTGLFTDYAYINEEIIAQRAGLTVDETIQTLIFLAKTKVIQYIPRKKTPFITYTSIVTGKQIGRAHV